ncbi:SDR family oxidoreductase [Fulvimonas sp. R45]|uniref:SDR family oxidoreductase n=1 Tax=Fulvimonas sp. R45 TaxID=3045937 RepID=UPI00265F9F4B|nr:SDR family oxidoreductase [Fulvimonas sp. R45]MDO1527257.1 SDR family oxidoreductase [Fulvimonas sp. R45]
MSRDDHEESAAQRQQRIQRGQEQAERQASGQSQGAGGDGKGSAAQAGARPHPENPLPAQHQGKPGSEAELRPRPQFEAPAYKGSDKLAGMVALVTGGDSGIGRAVAVLFAREGADVSIVYLCEHEDARETRRLVEAEGRRCLLIDGNVQEPGFCETAVRRTLDEFGKLSVLVNNAAFQEHAADIAELSHEHFDETVRTNVYGYFNMAKAALPHMGEGCSIVNTGSETGLFGSKQLLDYSMTKGAIHAFTKALASNVAKQGIRVNAVAPGPVWTPLNPADRPADKVQDFGKSSTMGRPAQPEEVAPAYVFLASPVTGSYVSGAILPVMGGPTS